MRIYKLIWYGPTENKIYDKKIVVNVKAFYKKKKKKKKNLQNGKNNFGLGQFWWEGRSTANQQFFKVGLNILRYMKHSLVEMLSWLVWSLTASQHY